MWKGWYVRKLIKSKSADNNLIVPDAISIEDGMPIINWGDSGDIVPTTEDDKDSILAATDKVGINLLGSSELNNGDSVELLIADEIDINLPDEIDINSPIMTEPDVINSADAALSSNIINGAENDIASKIAAANECRNAKDLDLDIIRKVMRREEKSTRRDIARRFTGSRRLYHKAVPKIQPSVVVIQSHARMFLARRKVISMRGGVYCRRANGSHTGRNDCNPQVQDNSDVSDQTPSATTSTARYTVPGTRRISAQASIFSQQSFYITLSYDPLSMIGENGEMTYDAGDTGSNVFAISTRDRDTLSSPPKVFSIRGEEPSTKFYIRLDGEFVCKVEVDRGAWGEYDDNPIDVMDWHQIMLYVRKFAGRAFVLHVEIKLNHQGERTPWTRGEEECWIGLQLSYVQFHTKSGLDEDILTYQFKAYEMICNSLIRYDMVLLHDHDKSVVNHTNIQTVIARIDKNILTLAGNLRDNAVLLTKHNTLDTQQNNHMSTGSIIPCSRDNSIEVDIVSGTSIGISLMSCIEQDNSDENMKGNSLQPRIGLPSMDITSHNATNATSSPHATIMHYSRQATYVSIIPIMDVAYKVNDSAYQDGERMPNKLLRSSRLTSCQSGRSDNDTGIDWYIDNVFGTYIHLHLVLVDTLMISKVLDNENINTTYYTAVLWNRIRKGIYSQQQWTQAHGYSMYIFLHWHVNMGSNSLQSRQLGRKLYEQRGAEKVLDKKDQQDVNRKSPCNDVTKRWLNLDGRGVLGYRTKADTGDTHPVQETVHTHAFVE